MNDEALKPCPFCGSKEVSFANLPGEHYAQVVCTGCGAFGPAHDDQADDFRERAARDWNRRDA